MYRILIYLLAIANIAVGFLIRRRSDSRFGFQTYRSYLDRVERQTRQNGTQPG